MVHQVFAGRGHGIAQILSANAELAPQKRRQWLRIHAINPSALPCDVTAHQWADLFAACNRDGTE
jgi:23S rRNA (adenine-N6)-dimethyltransferase